ncbi:MAG: hypothetical protein CMJ51_03100 [Planctomycetaceae bacterium]|nr:hypothetical protein [Planctomycetaceae bacterium]
MQDWPIPASVTDIFCMDAIRKAPSTRWEQDSSSTEAETSSPETSASTRPLAVEAEDREDLSRMMDPPSIIPTPASSGPEGSEAHRSEDPDSPRLRLAGTDAGPLTDEVRHLLELRAHVLRLQARHLEDADLIRNRLARGRRQDPIELVTGDDAFARTTQAISRTLADIDEHLARSRPGFTVEIETSATDLLRRS